MRDLFDGSGTQIPPGAAGPYPALVQLLAVIGVPLGKTRLVDAARIAGLRAEGARAYTGDIVVAELRQAMQAGWVRQMHAGYVCDDVHGKKIFREAALDGRVKAWQPAIWKILAVPQTFGSWDYLYLDANALSILRIAICTGVTGKALEALRGYLRQYDITHLFFRAFCQPFDAPLFELTAPAERDYFAERSLMWMFMSPHDSAPQLVQWALQRCADKTAAEGLRYRAAEHLLWQGRADEALALIAGDESGNALALPCVARQP
jgi:hypothetical protein